MDAEAEKARTRDCPLSHGINLGVTRTLLRPPTNNPPDSFTYIAGIRCQQSGFLKQDTMLQSSIQHCNSWQTRACALNSRLIPA